MRQLLTFKSTTGETQCGQSARNTGAKPLLAARTLVFPQVTRHSGYAALKSTIENFEISYYWYFEINISWFRKIHLNVEIKFQYWILNIACKKSRPHFFWKLWTNDWSVEQLLQNCLQYGLKLRIDQYFLWILISHHLSIRAVLAVCICTNGMHMHMHVHMQDSRPGGVHTAIEKRLLCGAW